MKSLLIALILILSWSHLAADDSAAIIEKVKQRFNSVHDYEVDAFIRIDVDFIKVPDTKAKIYYKQPDKIKVKSEGFALIPKEGLKLSPQALFRQNFTTVLARNETVDGTPTSVIKIIPNDESEEVILTTVWIDTKNSVIKKIESSTRTKGTFNIVLKYDFEQVKYPLPVEIVFYYEFKKAMNIPHMPVESGKGEKKENDKQSATKKGTATIKLSGYRVNSGVPDEIFKD